MVTSLSWGDEKSLAQIADHYAVDVIIGSELAYDADNIKLLFSTIDYFKQRNPKLVTIIGFSRYPQLHKNLLTHIEGRHYREVTEEDMDECYRDWSIGIAVLE